MEVNAIDTNQRALFRQTTVIEPKGDENVTKSGTEAGMVDSSVQRAAQTLEQQGTSSQEQQLAQAKQKADSVQQTTSTAVASTDSEEEDSAYQAIVAKADSGQTLTSAEMSQLQAKDPGRYQKALRNQEARQNLRSNMETDPNHATQAAWKAISSANRQSGDSSLVSALNSEYAKFSRQYDQVIIQGSPAVLTNDDI